MSNAMETGNKLQSLATQIQSEVNGYSAHSTGALVDAQRALQQCKLAAETPISEVVSMLGEQHPGAVAIIGNTGLISEICESAFNEIQGIIERLNGMPESAGTLSFVYQNVGAQIAASGQ